MKVKAIAAMAALVSVCGVSVADVSAAAVDPLRFPDYFQTVTATFASQEDASRAEISIAPLPDGASRAFGARWDDTTPRHIAKAAMLERAGVKGSFYIVGHGGIGADGVKAPFRATGILDLIRHGHAIGNHSLTHKHLMNLSPEAVFRQMLLSRIVLECDTDHSIVSFAAPFGWAPTKWPADEVKTLAAKMLVECGMWVSGDNPITSAGVPEDVWYPAHRFSANDRKPNRALFLKGLKSQTDAADASPLSPRITLGTHSWCDEAGNAVQERLLRENCIRPDWVQMNDYEYGAYRYSAINGSARRTSVSGNRAVFTVKRFSPAALGDSIALSIAISASPTSVECGGRALERGANGTWRLPHDASRRTACRIGMAGEGGKCAEIPGVELAVRPDVVSGKVRVTVANKTDKPIGDVYGVVHLPPEFADRRRTFRLKSLAAGGRDERVFDCGAAEPSVYPVGMAMYAASADFTRDGERERIWAVAEAAPKAPRKTLPKDVAWVTKAVPAGSIGEETIKAVSAGTGPLSVMEGGLEWVPRTGTVEDAWGLVTPQAPRKGKSDASANVGERAVAFQFVAREGVKTTLVTNAKARGRNADLYLNGERLEVSGNKTVLPVRPGVNRLAIRYAESGGDSPMPIVAAVCENGSLDAPCECVPFADGAR